MGRNPNHMDPGAQAARVDTHDVLNAMSISEGVEAYQLARRLAIPLPQLKVLLGRLIVAGQVISRRDKPHHATGHMCTRYYLSNPANQETGRHVSSSAPLARDAALKQVLAVMKSGGAQSGTELARALGSNVHRVVGLIKPLIDGGQIATRSIRKPGGRRCLVYCLAAADAQDTKPDEPDHHADHTPDAARPDFGAEYGRMLSAHRDLRTSRRSRDDPLPDG
jgi:hypothetical protein